MRFEDIGSTRFNSNPSRGVWKLVVLAVACAVTLVGLWSLQLQGNGERANGLDKKQMYAKGPLMITTRTSNNEENCVSSLTKKLGQWDGERGESLLTSFPLSPKLVVSLEKSDGTSKKMNRAQIEQDMTDSKQGNKSFIGSVLGRLDELGRKLKRPHKRMPVDSSSRHLILLEDNAVISINTDACHVDGVYFNRREGVHRDVRQVVEDNMEVAQDSGKSAPAPTPINKCPLSGHDACRKMLESEAVFETSSVIGNILPVVDAMSVIATGLSIMKAHPKIAMVVGVFNSLLGFLGNAQMTAEDALNQAKQYTDEVVAEVYNCMDHEFARSWTHHIRVQVEDIHDAVEGVSLLHSPLERIHHTWEPAAQACNSVGNKYRMFLEEYNREESADFLIGQTVGIVQICVAVYMQYMVDIQKMTRQPRGYDASKVKSDMKRAIGDIDMFMKVGIVALDANYRKTSVCGNKLSLVAEKMTYLYQDFYLPSICLSSSALGGKVIRDAYQRYPHYRVNVGANLNHKVTLRRGVTNPRNCLEACLEDDACLTVQYRRTEKDCLSFDTTLRGLVRRRGDEVFVLENRHTNAMVVNPNIPNSRAVGASVCLRRCLNDWACHAADASGGSCRKNPVSGNIDYVVFKNAVLVVFENYEWTGPKPAAVTVGGSSVLHCLAECARTFWCVAIDYDGVNLKCWMYNPSDGYPGTHTLDRRFPIMKFIHYDIHSYSERVYYQPLVSRQPDLRACPQTNLALNKTTGESLDSPWGNAPKESAVDGEINYDKCALVSANGHGQVWWYVDLGAEYSVCSVTISYPPNSLPEHMDDILIFVTNRKPSANDTFSAFQNEACHMLTGFAGTKTFRCDGGQKVGRYVGLDNKKDDPHFLLLCEVQVRGTLKAN